MRLAAVAFGVLAMTACAGGGTPISGDSRNVGGVTVTFRIEPSRVKPGQSVRFALNLQNNSGQDTTVRYPSGQRYDFYVQRDGTEVWRWSQGRAFVQAEQRDVIPGSSGRRYVEAWEPDAAGTYRAFAVLHAQGFGDDLSDALVVG